MCAVLIKKLMKNNICLKNSIKKMTNIGSDDTFGQDFPVTQLSGSPSLNRVMCKELFSSCLCDTEVDWSQCSQLLLVYFLSDTLFRK